MSSFPHLKTALKEEKSGNYTRAFNVYNVAVEKIPSSKTRVKIIAKKAYCLEQVGNYREAEDLIEDLISNFPNEPESYLQTSLHYLRRSKIKQAKLTLTSAINKFPDYLELYLTLSYILKETERTNESIEILKKALLQDKLTNGKGGIKRKDIWAELGNLYYERGNYNSCIACLKKSLRLEDKNTHFLHYDTLAKSYLKLDDAVNAKKYIELHLDLFEDRDPSDFILKARVHARLNELHLSGANLLQAYDREGVLKLKSEDMEDFAPLIKTGFFENIENVHIDED